MIAQSDLFMSLAEIAGVFVGFGALIGALSKYQEGHIQAARVQGIVLIGLLVVIASLIPLNLSIYGLQGGSTWRFSSLIFLTMIWACVLAGLRSEFFRPAIRSRFGEFRTGFLVLWATMQVPIQIPLILNILGLFGQLAPAFYTTALIVNLLEAAFLLGLLVLSPNR